jgi:hypothetical protein
MIIPAAYTHPSMTQDPEPRPHTPPASGAEPAPAAPTPASPLDDLARRYGLWVVAAAGAAIAAALFGHFELFLVAAGVSFVLGIMVVIPFLAGDLSDRYLTGSED